MSTTDSPDPMHPYAAPLEVTSSEATVDAFGSSMLPVDPQGAHAEPRPRWWTSIAVAGIALTLCIAISTVMIFVAMIVVTGERNP
ncbi:MAG: hypothetical protein WBD20_13825, partial [Pirellulaceae bacterium]